MRDLWYLVVAYAFVWVAVFAYVCSITQRQRALEQSITTLQAALEREQNQQ
ncbi:MAG TPA: CcmD family protein [Anaerolineae bacterium]|nr:CcmD family protein [Anaerolineae bacterium]